MLVKMINFVISKQVDLDLLLLYDLMSCTPILLGILNKMLKFSVYCQSTTRCQSGRFYLLGERVVIILRHECMGVLAMKASLFIKLEIAGILT